MLNQQLFSRTLLTILIHSYFTLVLCINYNSPSQNLPFTLGPNLINNPNISSPIIAPYYFTAYPISVNGWTTKGKYVQIIDACLQQGYGKTCPIFKGIACGWQFIDVDSIRNNEQYYQEFELVGGREFRLEFDWISETGSNIDSMGLSVQWNKMPIFTIFDISCTLKASTFYLQSKEGRNQLVFLGAGIADSAGIMIRNIRLQDITYRRDRPVNFWNLSTIIYQARYSHIFAVFYAIKELPIIRQIHKLHVIKAIFQFMLRLGLQFNHLLLYNYHQRNFTNMSSIILAGVQALDDERGFLLDTYIYPFIGTSSSAIAYNQHHTAMPANMNKIVTSYMQRPNGIRLQLTDAIFMDFPIIILFFAFGWIFFRLLFKFRVSLLLRPCSIIGCFIMALLAGKIEVFTFHFISQALNLVSINFRHKLQVAGIIMVYFTAFLLAISSMLLFRSFYGKTLKHIFDICKYPHSSFMFATFLLVFDVLLGFAHRLLLDFPFIQLCTLMVIEVICLTLLLVYLFRCRISRVSLGIVFCGMNCARLIFIITLLIFQITHSSANVSTIQQYLFYTLLGLWAISILSGLLYKCLTVYFLVYKISSGTKARRSVYQVGASPLKAQSKLRQSDVIKTAQQQNISSRLQLLKKRMKATPKGSKGTKLMSVQVLKTKLSKN